MTAPATPPDEAIFAIERPDPRLWTYYLLRSLLAGPFFWAYLVFLRFRYRTLGYRFDDEGVSMRWGILFRREIHLTYARIQDIHLLRNAVERRLGLARIQIQTASGSSKAEMTLEGLTGYEAVRDFLYSRMRGTREPSRRVGPAAGASAAVTGEAVRALRAAAQELSRVRRLLEARLPEAGSGEREAP